MTRILVVRRGGLGDTLLVAPLLRALRRRHAGADLHLAGVREFCDVLCGYGVVDVAHSSEHFELWSEERARPRLASFDLVLGDAGTGMHVAFDPRVVAPGVPFGLQLARQVGLEPDWPQDAWLLPPRRFEHAAGDVALAPGSGGARKCWPREHWLALAGRLARQGRALQVVVGPAELERDDPRTWPWPPGTGFVVEPRAFDLAQRLERSGWFFGNDSGTTHLAAMLGVPTVAVFVATDPDVWAPVGPHVRTVGGPDRLPSVDEVERHAG